MSSKEQKQGQRSMKVGVKLANIMKVPKGSRNLPKWVR
jgi:hypothetical protein